MPVHTYRTIENPIEGLLKPLELTINETSSVTIPNTEAVLNITPEYLEKSTSTYFYNKSTVLVLNCVIIRKNVRNVYIEFVDEKDFYVFMTNFKKDEIKYSPMSHIDADTINTLLASFNF